MLNNCNKIFLRAYILNGVVIAYVVGELPRFNGCEVFNCGMSPKLYFVDQLKS